MANAADDARAKAQEAKDKQAAEEKAKAEKADAAAKQRQNGEGGPAGEKGADAAVAAGQAPEVDPEATDPKAYLARIDALERLVKTLTAQQAGGAGPAPSENKDITAAGPGAAFDPRLTRPLPAGVSSAPSMQPIPAGINDPATALAPGDARAIWGTDAKGEPVQARTYGALEDEDVMVVATGYYDDAVRNPGDIITGYTGPAGSWFVPHGLVKEAGGIEAARVRWADFMRRRAA